VKEVTMRRFSTSWTNTLAKLGIRRFRRERAASRRSGGSFDRNLHVEWLEDRRLLATVTVSTWIDENNGDIDSIGELIANPGGAGISLREAVLAANATAGADIINFNSSFNVPRTIQFVAPATENSHLVVTDHLTINGPGSDLLTLRAFDPTPGSVFFGEIGDGNRIFDINGATVRIDVTLSGMKLTGGDVGHMEVKDIGSGGAIRSIDNDNLTLKNIKATNNWAAYWGGALHARLANNSTLIIDECDFGGDPLTDFNWVWGLAEGYGGAAINVETNNSTFEAPATLSIVNSTISGNETRSNAGGARIFTNTPTNISIENTVFEQNKAGFAPTSTPFRGGGLYARLSDHTTLTISDSRFHQNSTKGDGGGIWAGVTTAATDSSPEWNTFRVTIARTEITENTTELGSGGGLALINGKFTTGSETFSPTGSRMVVRDSLIADNDAFFRGGGAYFFGVAGDQMSVLDSKVSGNIVSGAPPDPFMLYMPGSGGGLYVYLSGSDVTMPTEFPKPKFTISGSSVYNNTADFHGGGIFVCSKNEGDFLAINTTISTNQVTDTQNGTGGGVHVAVYNGPGAATETVDAAFQNVTFTENMAKTGGGLHSDNLNFVRTKINNTLISKNNVSATNSTPSNLFGRIDIANSQYNLVGTGSTVLNLSGAPAALDSTNDTNEDSPLLGPLTTVNGGWTPTHALLAGSPAINTGKPLVPRQPDPNPPYDQRGFGFKRIIGGRIDIGAYEAGNATQTGSPAVLIVNTAEDQNNTGPELSLREAIALASAFPDVDVITFAQNVLDAGVIELDHGPLIVNTPVTIVSPDPGFLSIDAQGMTDVFQITQGITAGIGGLTIENGNYGVSSEGYVTLYEDVIEENGGGVFIYETGSLIMNRSTVRYNDGWIGGGLALLGSSSVITNSTINHNTASGTGGGIVVSGGQFTMRNSTVANNTAAYGGGGILLSTQTFVSIDSCTIAYNTSNVDPGGGILIAGGNYIGIRNSIVAENFAPNAPAEANISGSVGWGYVQYSLIGPSSPGISTSGPGNIVVAPGGAGLRELGDYGGPTQTIALKQGSQAIDHGSNFIAQQYNLTTDQRGEARIADGDAYGGAMIDMGAFELAADEFFGTL
jgi:hypothetical protein